MGKNKNTNHRFKVYKRHNFSCVYCDRKFTPPFDWDKRSAIHNGTMYLEIDHVIPLTSGGSDKIGNKQSLCGTCNLFKSFYSESQFYIRMLKKRDYYYDQCFGHVGRIDRFRRRGHKDLELRSIELFRTMYQMFKYTQRVVVYLSKTYSL